MNSRTTMLSTFLCAFTLTFLNISWADTNTKKDETISENYRTLILKISSEAAMLPIFEEIDLASKSLVKQTESFCSTKNKTSLSELRDSWANAANTWQQADSLLFGPTVDDNIDFGVYFLPIKKGIIKKLLLKDNITVKDVDAAGVGAQGLGALEYLLFSRENSTDEILQSFNDESNRCEYLLKTTELLNENISTITRQWKHYGVQFGLAGNNSLYFLESTEAMTLLVNKIYQSAQKVSNKKVGLLNSKNKIKKSTAYKLPAWRSGTSLAQVKANIKGIQRILEEGKILTWLKNNNKEAEVKEIRQLFDDILQQKVKSDDLFKALQNNPEDLQTLVEKSLKLTELIQTVVAPGMGVELGFNDNDGD